MLTPADLEVVERDPALPGLALVLDHDALADRLRAVRPELGLVSARATYVRYKPGTSCLVGYRLELADGEVLAFAKAYRRGDAAKATKARSKGGTAVAAVGDLVMVAHVAGDRDLPAAGGLERAGGRHRRLLRRVLPDAPQCWDAVPRCLRYKPERRWVGVVEHEGEPVALVKAYRRDDLVRAHAGLRFARGISPATPRLLGVSRRVAALASSWLPGETLSELLARPGGAVPTLEVAGEALAALHAGPPSGLPVATAEDDAGALHSAAEHLSAVAPRLGAAAVALSKSLGSRLVTGAPEAGMARHGDFSPDQVVQGDHGVALLDFDNAEFGDPAADLGQFVASLWVAHLVSTAPGPPAVSAVADFLAGYEAGGGVAIPGRVADHAAAALVRLAVEPFRVRAPDWPARTEALLERAAHLARPTFSSPF